MMTTNVTLGRPYRFPFDDKNKEYFYKPEEWKHFFPGIHHEVSQTEDRDAVIENDSQAAKRKQRAVMRRLPEPKLLPVVIAARMSLSFPFLISPVPLWTIDQSIKKRKSE